ncbi:heat-inducible transcriptional repressor HrcA, partial [Alphaproteobacteria bacterium]|nr:heat-inducible transcriptional repressor HrcA [Alphaproteobacteria bacterium]
MNKSNHLTFLNNRSHAIFNQIVTSYLETGSPVGSAKISQSRGGDYSSATIRSIMAELENAGLLYQPHISAGRIPTHAGLRLFVDGLMEMRGELTKEEQL